jgi:hypothetical protein
MMQTADLGEGNNIACGGKLHATRPWAVLVEREMRSGVMMILKIARQYAAQVTLVEDDNVIQTFTADRTDETLGVGILASAERDFDTVFATLVQLRAGALVIGLDAFFISRSEQLAALTVRHAVPAIFHDREFAVAGGLMSYGGSLTDAYRLAGVYNRPDSQGREASRPAGPAVHESRADHQPQDREGAGSHFPALAARSRRRGDRVTAPLNLLRCSDASFGS